MASKSLTRQFLLLRQAAQRRQFGGRPGGGENEEGGHAFVKMTDEDGGGGDTTQRRRRRGGAVGESEEMSDVPLVGDSNGKGGGLARMTGGASLPPMWVDVAEHAETLIADVRTKIAQYQELRQLSSRMAFPDEEEEARNWAKMRDLSARISKRLREAEARIKSLSSPDDQVRINVQHSLAQKLQVEYLKWRKVQKEQLEELQRQQRQSKMALASSPDALPDDDSAAGEDGDPLLSSASHHRDMSMKSLRRMDTAMMRERERELAQIARGIDELAQLFRSVSVLVIEQGTILDRIDYNMDNVVLKTEKGLKELTIAEEYQKGNCARNGITILVILNLVILALLAAKIS